MTERLTQGLDKLGLTFTDSQVDKLESYIQEVLEFNKGYNLMKAENADELAVNHILDSLVAVPALTSLIEELSAKKATAASQAGCVDKASDASKAGAPLSIADIGSGGGCPGIPLAIAFPNQHFTLVERMDKRCVFLESVVKKLGLTNVTVACTAADAVAPESFDLEVFRAFHPFDKKIITLLFRMLKSGGALAAYKAREEKILAEMDEIKPFIKGYEKIKLTVPFLEDHKRHLVIIRK